MQQLDDNPIWISTPRLRLRILYESDRDEYVRVQRISAELFGPWMPTPPAGQTIEEQFETQLHRAKSGFEGGTEYRFVGLLSDGRIGGFFNLVQVVRGAFENAIASWSVSADVAGRGLATEGVSALLTIAFRDGPLGLNLHRVGASVIPTNLRSMRVAEKVGFRREGLGIKYLRIAGQWQDHVLFAKLREEHSLSHSSHSD